MKLKIVSDGTAAGTQVIDTQTGEAVPGVYMLTWNICGDDQLADAMISLRGVPCEIVTVADEIKVGPMIVEDDDFNWITREDKDAD